MSKSKGINIYISRSLSTDINILNRLRENLLRMGSIKSVYFYYGTEYPYKDSLVRDADLVLSLPNEQHDNSCYTVGKGQYDEILLAQSLDIPVVRVNRNLSFNNIIDQQVVNPISWKSNYGIINNYIDDAELVILNNKEEKEEDLLLICNIK